MANDLNLITSNNADILLNLVSIAKKYDLDITKDTFLRTGNFGYLTEMSAKVIQNSILSKQIDFNELFASTAINPESLIQLCRSFNIDVSQAEASYGTLELTLNLNDASNQLYNLRNNQALVDKYGNEINDIPSDTAVIIDRGTKFQAGDVNFYIEKSIILWLDKTTNRWIAKYITTEGARTNFQYLDTTYLNTRIRIQGDVTYLTIFPRVYQYDILELQKLIHKSEIVYTSIINFSYSDHYIGSRLFYSANNSNRSDRKEVRLSSNMVGRDPFVEAIGGKLSVSFPNNLESFKPTSNSVISLETYVSRGASGNLNYSKPLSIIQNEKSTNKYQMIAYLKNGITYGGRNEPTIEQLRNLFIDQVSSRNVIATSSDLNLYFSKLKTTVGSISNSEVLFIKKRDDILRRYYDAFLLFRDNKDYAVEGSGYGTNESSSYVSSIIPTYTFETVRFNESFADKSIKYGHKVIPPNSNEDVALFTDDVVGDDYYIVPFHVHVSTKPINSVHYIFDRVNETVPLNADHINSDNWVYPSDFQIIRNKIDQDHYLLRFNFETVRTINENDYDFNLSVYHDGESLIKGDYTPSLTIHNREYRNTNTNETVNYAQIEIKVNVDEDENYGYDSLLSINMDFEGNKEESHPVFTKVQFRLKVRKKDDASEAGIVMNSISDPVSLFTDMQELMYSDVKINVNDSGNVIDSVDIFDVPVVHNSYLEHSNGDLSFFIEQMFAFTEMLRESQQNIDQSELINLKFYRSYGVSEVYNITKTNIDLRLDILTKLTTYNEAKALIDSIRVYIDGYNVNKLFRYSDLVADLMNGPLGEFIYSVVFRGLNGTWEQNIDSINTSNIYYPEYFNVSSDAVSNMRVYYYDPRSKEKRLLFGE